MTNADAMKQARRVLRHAFKHSPFFQKKLAGLKVKSIVTEWDFCQKVPCMQLEDLEAGRAQSGDPFGGRKCPDKVPLLTFQLEGDAELSLYLALNRGDLQQYAEALSHCWQLLGLKKGDKVAIFDYGSSPLSYLASSAFVPYLVRGAAERLGCIPLCNDGVSQMSHRAIEIVRLIQPRVFFVRSDCLVPFSQEAKRQGLRVSDYIGALVVAENEGVPSAQSCQDWASAMGVPVYRLLRVDAAMFLGVECPYCRLLHISSDRYFVETIDSNNGGSPDASSPGLLAITNLFARLTPTIKYVSQVQGVMAGRGCPQAPEDERVRLP